jgi:hypothetical protein
MNKSTKSIGNVVFHDQPQLEAVVPAVVVYPYENFPPELPVGWDRPCSGLLRRQLPFFPDQQPFRMNVLDCSDHKGHEIEVISREDWALWPCLNAPGRVGRLERLTYETCRRMAPETYLRIIATKQRLYPRKKQLTVQDVERIGTEVTKDPKIKWELLK